MLFKLLFLLAVFACVFLVVQQVSQVVLTQRLQRRQVNRRLELLSAGHPREQVIQLIRQRAHAITGTGLPGRLLADFHRKHAIAALRIGASQLIVTAVVAVAAILVLLLLVAVSLGAAISVGTVLVTAAFAVAVGAGLPYLYVTRRAQKRTRLMEEQFPVALDIFTRALRAGHPVAGAIELLTQEMPDPIGSEFGLVFDEVSYGSDLTTALHNLGDRWDLPDLRMFAVSLSVQGETGGNLAEILSNLSQVIRDRASMYLKVRALSADGRMTAWMLVVMPVVTFVLLFVINPSFFLDVAQDPIFKYGFSFLIVLYLIGAVWLRRLVNLKV
jgi:tight adherence protein B